MKKLALALVSIHFFAQPALAVETDKCPTEFTTEILNITPYQSSVSKKVPGWIDSRDALTTVLAEIQIKFVLDSKNVRTCNYVSATGASAKLFTIKKYDAEDGMTYESDRLLVKFAVDQSEFSMFPSVETYDPQSIRLFSQDAPQKTKIQTRLIHPSTRKPFNFDIGLANIKTN